MDQSDLIEYGYCHCGCGMKTNFARENNSKRRWIKGKPIMFINHHNRRKIGCRNQNKNGYICFSLNGKEFSLHRFIAENVLGKSLPKKSVVHHLDGNKINNKNSNIVICQDENYHRLLHRRLRAYLACGNANWLRCRYCKKYDKSENLILTTKGMAYSTGDYKQAAYHPICRKKAG